MHGPKQKILSLKHSNPEEFTPVEFEEHPTKFNLQAAGNVSNSDLYKYSVLSDVKVHPETIKGTLFNSGLTRNYSSTITDYLL